MMGRAKIPKLKKVHRPDSAKSPFKLGSGEVDAPDKKLLSSSVPPGAHMDQFRVVAYVVFATFFSLYCDVP